MGSSTYGVDVVLTKEDIDGVEDPGRKVAVVLDVIFATTTIVAALQAGARAVLPVPDLAAARALAEGRAPGSYLLAGELNAQAFPGSWPFQPTAMDHPKLRGRDLILATTNGTVALCRAAAFAQVYVAALSNGSAVAAHLLARHPGQDIVLVCAGSRGRFSMEDFYGAGHLASRLSEAGDPARMVLGDAALAARAAFAGSPPEAALAASRLGRLMSGRGMAADVRYAARLDVCEVVPVYREQEIVRA